MTFFNLFKMHPKVTIYTNLCRTSQLESMDNPIDKLFKYLSSKENDRTRSRTLTILGRNVEFVKACGRILDANFNELCDRVS